MAKGYVQKQGVDFDEVFAPVTRLEMVRLLLALAARNALEVHHLDVKSAFLKLFLLLNRKDMLKKEKSTWCIDLLRRYMAYIRRHVRGMQD